MRATTKRTKGQWMTVKQKWEIVLEYRRTRPAPSLSELVRWAQSTFSRLRPPSRSTILNILRQAEDIERKLQTAKTPKGHALNLRCPELEERLEEFLQQMEQEDVRLSRGLITDQAKDILSSLPSPPALKLSDGWMTGFMKRHDLRFRQLYGEAASVSPEQPPERRICVDLSDILN